MPAITNEAQTNAICCVCKKTIMTTDSWEAEHRPEGGRCYHLRCKGQLDKKD